MLLVCGESRLCRYCVAFEIEERPHTTYYKLTSLILNHLPDCVDGFKAEILRRKRFLEDKSGVLKKIIKFQIKNNGCVENPKVGRWVKLGTFHDFVRGTQLIRVRFLRFA